MTDKFNEEFLQALKEVEKSLLALLFKPYSFEEKGFAYFVQYKRENSIVKFLYGPPEYEVDIIVYTAKGKFEFKDLLENSDIAAWVNKNKYLMGNEKNIRNEMLWFVELLKFSLPIIE